MGDLGSATTRQPWGRRAALGLLGVLLLGAAPAQAGGRFGRGFEDELGRIAAREVVRFGKIALLGGHRPVYGARWATAYYPAPGYEAYGVYDPPPRPPVRYRAPAPPPVYYPAAAPPVYYPAAAPVYPAAPPSYAPTAPAPCEHTTAAPYEEHIVWERYERVIQRPAPPPPQDYEPYGTYDQQARY